MKKYICLLKIADTNFKFGFANFSSLSAKNVLGEPMPTPFQICIKRSVTVSGFFLVMNHPNVNIKYGFFSSNLNQW